MLREADRVGMYEDADALFVPVARQSPQAAHSPALPTQRYGEDKGFPWSGALLTLMVHVLLIAGFFMIRDHVVTKRQEKLTVINLTPAPPPPAATPEQPQPERVEVVTPRPMVQIPVLSPLNIPTTPDPVPLPTPPSPPTNSSAPPAPPAPPSVVQSDELGSKMVSGSPPRYPTDSRRKHEQGTVVLSLTLGYDGRVMAIAVSKSSGFDRLDDAALAAVRKWRWEPIKRNGQPVMVRGMVDIPFVLQG